jgi:hypothetical protein
VTEEDGRDFVWRIRAILEAGHPPFLEVTDQDAVVLARRDRSKGVGALLDDFAEARGRSFVFVAALQETELKRAGIHLRIGRLTVSNHHGQMKL